jgi:ABC-type transporter Mla subunit MlaD
MAQTVKLLGHGGQVRVEKELGWDRGVIRKGMKELESAITCIDNFSARVRNLAEKHLPNLLEDIRDIVEPVSQADPSFSITNQYSPITAPKVRRR